MSLLGFAGKMIASAALNKVGERVEDTFGGPYNSAMVEYDQLTNEQLQKRHEQLRKGQYTPVCKDNYNGNELLDRKMALVAVLSKRGYRVNDQGKIVPK